jgi:hypothetical protein
MLPRLFLLPRKATHLLAGFGLVWLLLIGIRDSRAFQSPSAPAGHLRILPQRKASWPDEGHQQPTTKFGGGVPRTSPSSGGAAVFSRSGSVLLFAKNAIGEDGQSTSENLSNNNDKLKEEEEVRSAAVAASTAAAAVDYAGGATMIARSSSSRSSTTTRRTDRNVGGYDPSERLSPEREVNVGDPQIKVMEEKEFSVTSILRELAAIQQQGPRKYCILGTRHCSFLHQQIIELLYVFASMVDDDDLI